MHIDLAPRWRSGGSPALRRGRLDIRSVLPPVFWERSAACGLFALSEISKGAVVVCVGDFATADAVGELIGALTYPADALRIALSLAA